MNPSPAAELTALLPDPWNDPIFARDQAELMLNQPGVVLFTVPGAHLMAAVIPDAPADILTIHTMPQLRGQGLAGCLLKAFISYAHGRGCPHITLEVRVGNAAARALYLKHGFTEVAVRRGYYQYPREDALVLTRAL